MNRGDAKELIPMLQAFVDHKEIQRSYGVKWVDDGDEFHLDQEYRIKPEPVERWIACFSNGYGYKVYHHKASCTDAEQHANNFIKAIKLVEEI